MAARVWLWLRLIFFWLSEGIRSLFGGRRPYATLFLEISGDLPEAPPPPLWGATRPRTFAELVSILRAARADAQLKAVLLSFHDARLGWAQAFELRRSISRLRDAGKRVWAVVSQASPQEYVAASSAEKLWVTPAGGIELSGLAIEPVFFARALQKLGIEPLFVQAGRYKTAGEAFTRASMSPEHREMLEQLLDDLYDQMVHAVAEGRGFSLQQARELCDRGPFSSREAAEVGLADGVDYVKNVQQTLQAECEDPFPVCEFLPYFRRRQRWVRRRAWHLGKQHVALVYASGPIVSDGYGGLLPASAARFSDLQRCFHELSQAGSVRAVVVRIDSPGGSALASDLLWHALQELARVKPVVVSCGNVAASGGYYLALAGALIIAEASTITGSIGVLSGRFRLRGLYDRLGIDKDRVERGAHTALQSDYAPLSEEEIAILRRHAEDFYERFTNLVAETRLLSPPELEHAAGGRVWTGQQALAVGLVDSLGGLEEALLQAKRLAGFDPEDPVPVAQYPRPHGFIENLLRPFRPPHPLPVPPSSLLQCLYRPQVWAILPFWMKPR